MCALVNFLIYPYKCYLHILYFDCTLTFQISSKKLTGLSQCRLRSEYLALHKNRSFLLPISSVNMTKSSHIY